MQRLLLWYNKICLLAMVSIYPPSQPLTCTLLPTTLPCISTSYLYLLPTLPTNEDKKLLLWYNIWHVLMPMVCLMMKNWEGATGIRIPKQDTDLGTRSHLVCWIVVFSSVRIHHCTGWDWSSLHLTSYKAYPFTISSTKIEQINACHSSFSTPAYPGIGRKL